MPEILGSKELRRTIRKLQTKSEIADNGSVIVGYTANYALHVHETFKPAPKATTIASVKGRQGKFLEQPARTMIKEFQQIIKRVAPKKGIISALLIVGLRLQRESQKLVPIDTGNLRASAFTRKE